MRVVRGPEHFTITEAHPFHGDDGGVAFRAECPKCRAERAADSADAARVQRRWVVVAPPLTNYGRTA